MTHPEEAAVDTLTPAEARLTALTDEDGLIGALVVMRDITDHKETEKRLRASERRFRAMFEAHSAPMLLIEPQSGAIEEANVAAAEFYGYAIEELTSMSIQQINCRPPSEVAAERRRARAQDRNHFEFKHELASGEIRIVEVHSSPIEVDGQELLFSIVHDITERKRREREYEQIFNGVNDGITIHDPDTGEILDANETYLNIFGYDDVETLRDLGIEGLSVTEEGYTEERARALINDVAVSEEPRTVEWQIETADSEQRWFESTVAPAKIAGEERILAIQRDVTERKRRQREFEEIFNGVRDAISVHDPDTVKILDVNDAYLDMFGFETTEEVRERGVSGISATEKGYTEQRGREIHQRVVKRGQPESLEWQSELRSGERIWLGVKVAPAVIGGEQRTIAVHRDITERKRREQRLTVFNRVLRHNLRNQLDVIRSYAEELATHTRDEHVDRIIEATDELADIGRSAREIDQVISKTKTPTELDIAELLRETIAEMDSDRSDVTVTTELPDTARLRTYQRSLILAVENALENAVENAASAVTVGITDSTHQCTIIISDDGPGIPEEILTPLEVGRETPLQHGKGLGLWQLRWCVAILNGDLSFETGDGTTIRIAVPTQSESPHPD
jgi:PAS domain S-box-containing protein